MKDEAEDGVLHEESGRELEGCGSCSKDGVELNFSLKNKRYAGNCVG